MNQAMSIFKLAWPSVRLIALNEHFVKRDGEYCGSTTASLADTDHALSQTSQGLCRVVTGEFNACRSESSTRLPDGRRVISFAV